MTARLFALVPAFLAVAVGCGRAGGSGAATVGAAASPATSSGPMGTARSDEAAIARARADSVRRPYTTADIHFMTMMIGHHAQALVMARMAPTHGASATVRRLADRIISAQQDEIVTMQRWLRDRRQPVPDPAAPTGGHDAHAMHGGATAGHAGHAMAPMAGMLTDAQLRELDAARGPEFDRLFLTYMIQHHRGAVKMVEELFASDGAGQDETVFKFASDAQVDQATEIARMERMLADLLFPPG